MPKKWTTQQFIEKAVEIHGDRYDYSATNYVHNDGHVDIKCLSCNTIFSKMAKMHIQGVGCLTCHKQPRVRKTLEKYLEQARNVYGSKYDYSLVTYTDFKTPIDVICPTHGRYTVHPSRHLKGQACHVCFMLTKAKEFFEKAFAVHGDLYDYTDSKYTGALDKLTIKCKEHGKFTQIASNHLRGNGCGACADALCSQTKRLTTAQFIDKSKSVWGDKYTYDNTVYDGAGKEVTVTCPEHGDFQSLARIHTAGCTSCSGCQKRGYSSKSIRWLKKEEARLNLTIQHAENGGEFKLPNTTYHVDGYHAETKTIWEYLGRFWHGDPNFYPADFYNKLCKCTMGELYEKTMKRIQHIESLGYKVIYKWEERND